MSASIGRQSPDGEAIMREEILTTIPQQQSDSVLEVVLVVKENNRSCIELRQLVWGSGLGWYRQHTLTLEATAARALLRGLKQLRNRCGGDGDLGQERKVIPFRRGDLLHEAMG
jgi:hypothetical protein